MQQNKPGDFHIDNHLAADGAIGFPDRNLFAPLVHLHKIEY